MLFVIFLVAGITQAETFTVGPGQSIQTAIDSASPGDIIEVQTGLYQENINITKQLTIKAVNITEEGVDNPVLDGGMLGDTITISADGVVLKGLVATNGFSGIAVKSNNNTIEGNYANYNRDFGIAVWNNVNNSLLNNTAIENKKAGIVLLAADYNIVRGNKATKNSFGILIEKSSMNVLWENSFFDNSRDASDSATEVGINQWDDGKTGNYYGTNSCTDADLNGICDSEYNIPDGSSVDRYPLAKNPFA